MTRPWLHAACAGALLFVVYLACFFGIPFDFSGDLGYIYDMTKSVGVGTHLAKLVNPLTPAWFFLDDMIHLRPLQFLFLKLMYLAGGLNLPTAHFLAALAMGGLGAALYLLLHRISGSVLFSWLGVLLYGTFPTHVFSMISIVPVDFQFVELTLVLCSIWLFWRLVNSPGLSLWGLLGRLAGVVIMTWLATKLKSSAKVVPCIFLSLLFLSAFRPLSRLPWRRFAAVFVTVLAMFVLVVPMVHRPPSSSKEKKSLQLNLDYASQRTFQSRPEGAFALFTLKRVAPGSLTESYGFFLGWIFWIALAWALIRRLLRKSPVPANPADDFFWPALVWFLFALAGFALGEPPLDSNNRYLNYGLLPSVLLLFTCLFPAGASAPARKGMWKALIGGLAACFLLTIAQNAVLFTGWLRHAVGFQWALVEAEKQVFADAYQRQPANEEELYRAHSGMRDGMLWADWEISAFQQRQALLANMREKGTVYFLSRSGTEAVEFVPHGGGTAEWMGTVSLYDAPTMTLRGIQTMRKLRGKAAQGNDITVFRLRPAP